MPRKKQGEAAEVPGTGAATSTAAEVPGPRRGTRKRKEDPLAVPVAALTELAEGAKKAKTAAPAPEPTVAAAPANADSDAAAEPAAADEQEAVLVVAIPAKAAAKKKQPAKKAAKAAAAEDEDEEGGDVGDADETPVQVTDFTTPKKNPGEIKIVSWNVAGWNAIIGKGFATYIKEESPDIICIQETKIAPSEKLESYLPGYHGHFLAPTEKKGYSGVAVFSKEKPLSWTDGIGYKDGDDEGRAITAEFADFYLLSTYIPNAGRKLVTLPKRMEWDDKFLEFVKKLEAVKPVIWCGDLNVAHTEIDLANPTTNKRNAGFTVEERNNFTRFLATGFVDSFRHFHPDEKDAYTFWSFLRNARGKNIGWRLDYFVVSQKLMPRVTASYRRPYVLGSDHCPIAIHFVK
eukprot:TRINITY_DN4140_c0_g3_i1.p1 TRINITY_DN4140_c0_g3~~TRINITY_DN4140_c0_g3_i1.p1  ORF type:complete len:445 (+),score=149.52 TRINITY_DN4140_c0_g3_i1:126-1337(+)